MEYFFVHPFLTLICSLCSLFTAQFVLHYFHSIYLRQFLFCRAVFLYTDLVASIRSFETYQQSYYQPNLSLFDKKKSENYWQRAAGDSSSKAREFVIVFYGVEICTFALYFSRVATLSVFQVDIIFCVFKIFFKLHQLPVDIITFFYKKGLKETSFFATNIQLGHIPSTVRGMHLGFI